MSNQLLQGKKGVIFGALNEASIAWKVAEKAVAAGAKITLSNTPMALRMGELNALGERLNAKIIPADATSTEDLTNVFKESVEILGGKIDFVLHSIGMSPNVRKKHTYDDLDYDMLRQTLDISAVSFHKMIQQARKLDAISDGGSIVALSYAAHFFWLQRYGRREGAAGIHRPQFRLHLRARKRRARKHHLAIAHHDHRRSRRQGHGPTAGFLRQNVAAGQCLG